MRLDHSRRLRALELDRCHVARPMRNKERASWDLGTGSHGVLGEVIGTVQVRGSVRESCMGVMVFWWEIRLLVV
nr:hypothetical protein [Tanacetum cinerariifolium]